MFHLFVSLIFHLMLFGLAIIAFFYALGAIMLFLKFNRIQRKFRVKIAQRKIIMSIIFWPIVQLHFDRRISVLPKM